MSAAGTPHPEYERLLALLEATRTDWPYARVQRAVHRAVADGSSWPAILRAAAEVACVVGSQPELVRLRAAQMCRHVEPEFDVGPPRIHVEGPSS